MLLKTLNCCTQREALFGFSSESRQRSSVPEYRDSSWPKTTEFGAGGEGELGEWGRGMGYTGTKQGGSREPSGRSGPRWFWPRESSAHRRLSDAVSCSCCWKMSSFSRLNTFLPAQNKTPNRLPFSKPYQVFRMPELGGARVGLLCSLQAAPLCICIMESSLMA